EGASGRASGCGSTGPLTGSFDGASFQPVAWRAVTLYWTSTEKDALLVTLRDHLVDCSPAGGVPTATWMEVNITIPKPSQAPGVYSLDPSIGGSSDLPVVGAGRYVYLPSGGISNALFVGIAGTLCVTAIDATHVAGRLEVHQEKVDLGGEFAVDICPPSDGGI